MYKSWRIWSVYGLLVIIAIPWYWRWIPIPATTLCMGMPVWAFTSVVVSAVVSLYTSWLFSFRWPDEEAPTWEEDDR